MAGNAGSWGITNSMTDDMTKTGYKRQTTSDDTVNVTHMLTTDTVEQKTVGEKWTSDMDRLSKFFKIYHHSSDRISCQLYGVGAVYHKNAVSIRKYLALFYDSIVDVLLTYS